MPSTIFNPPVPTLEQITGLGESTIPDSDGVIEPGENDFASSTNKRTLRSYISSLTRGQVPTVVEGDERGLISYNGPIPDHGNAYPLDDGSSANRNTFATVDGGGVNLMQEYSNSGLFDGAGDKNLGDIINKGELGSAKGEDSLSGHLLLQGIVGSNLIGGDASARTDGAQALIDSIPRTLDGNIWNPYPDAATGGTRAGGSAGERPTGLIKTSRGEEILSSAPDSQSGRVGVDELSKIAVDIMLKATGKPNGPEAYPTAGNSPAQVQEGLKRIDTEDLRVRNYPGIAGLNSTVDGTGFELPTSDGVGETRYSDKSFGVTYNPLENFTDLSSARSSYLIIATSALGAITVVGGILAAATKPADRPTYPKLAASTNQDRHLVKGSFKFEPPQNGLLEFIQDVAAAAGVETDIAQLLNIYIPTNLIADYGQCVIIGFASLIGTSYSDDDIIAEPLIGSTENKVFNTLGFLKLLAVMALRVAAISLTGEKGYYMNLFREIIKDSGQLLRGIGENPASLLSPSGGIGAIASSKIVRFINVLAAIGDMIVLQSYAKDYYKFNATTTDPYIDGFNLGGTLVKNARDFAKQRIKGARFGGTRGSHLSVNELPSAHLIPANYASLWPEGSGNDKKLTSFKASATAGEGRTNLRISQERVAQIEHMLDAEYMPFYFQDLRTNEIIAFHAFLDDVSDSYTANYNSAGGYGRIEEIKTYKDTKRSVGVTFHVIATNPEDFDYMWWQINKLTTMVYPQWSRGRELTAKVNDQDFKFVQPFSQIPNATPVIRVRVGDLIRSNYSRFNLKRLFGYNDVNTNQTNGTSQRYYALPGYYIDHNFPEGPPVKVSSIIELGSFKPAPFNPNDEQESHYVVKNDIESFKFIRIKLFDIKSTPAISPTDLAKVFYEAEGDGSNSVIRSFETSMGKGLASVITSLQFTWNDALWGAGEDGTGNRAPRSCKVQMNFDPIHDIAPGLDHEGLNRAPIYPVGGLVNRLVEGGEESPYGFGTFSSVVPPE